MKSLRTLVVLISVPINGIAQETPDKVQEFTATRTRMFFLADGSPLPHQEVWIFAMRANGAYVVAQPEEYSKEAKKRGRWRMIFQLGSQQATSLGSKGKVTYVSTSVNVPGFALTPSRVVEESAMEACRNRAPIDKMLGYDVVYAEAAEKIEVKLDERGKRRGKGSPQVPRVINYIERSRMWLAPALGCFPMRIERSRFGEHDRNGPHHVDVTIHLTPGEPPATLFAPLASQAKAQPLHPDSRETSK
jgi:hypothetical protein